MSASAPPPPAGEGRAVPVPVPVPVPTPAPLRGGLAASPTCGTLIHGFHENRP
jgi:hypothetical protein